MDSAAVNDRRRLSHVHSISSSPATKTHQFSCKTDG